MGRRKRPIRRLVSSGNWQEKRDGPQYKLTGLTFASFLSTDSFLQTSTAEIRFTKSGQDKSALRLLLHTQSQTNLSTQKTSPARLDQLGLVEITGRKTEISFRHFDFTLLRSCLFSADNTRNLARRHSVISVPPCFKTPNCGARVQHDWADQRSNVSMD